jgi:hypothetical protein
VKLVPGHRELLEKNDFAFDGSAQSTAFFSRDDSFRRE